MSPQRWLQGKCRIRIGGLLVQRERHLTHLTDLGRLIQPQLEQIWNKTEAAKTTAKSFLKLENAPLNLGVMCTSGLLRGISFVTDFWRSNKASRSRCAKACHRKLGELLRKGELDVGIMAQWEPFDERLNVERLYQERFVVAFLPRHGLAAQNGVAMANANGESYLFLINCEFKDHLRSLREEQGRRAAARLSQRARGLDPDHGDGRHRHRLSAGILRPTARPADAAADRAAGGARGLAGHNRGASLLTAGRRLRARDQGVPMAGMRN